MKTLADLKRVQVGDIFTITYAFTDSSRPHKHLNVSRKIEKVQSNALMFEGRSWLYFPKAKAFRAEPDGFSILNDIGNIVLTYRQEAQI